MRYIGEMEKQGPKTLTRKDGTVLVFVPTEDYFRFGVYMVGNPCYNVGQAIADKETKK
jgi:hypothetical protein